MDRPGRHERGLQQLTEATIEFHLPAELRELQQEAERLASSWRQASAVREDSWLIGYDRKFAQELGRRGWIGMNWSPTATEKFDPLARFVVYETLITHGAPLAAMWIADRQIGPTLVHYGTDAQQERWLPGILAGTSTWCLGMSEPNAGSDIASLRTRAVRHGDDWVVTGEKIWTSGAADADWCYLVVRTNGDRDTDRHAGLSELAVDMRSPGIAVHPITDLTGNRHFCQVTFDDVRVPSGHLIGRDNRSFRQLMRQLEHERGGVDRLVSNYALFRDVLRSGDLDRADPVLRQEVAEIEARYRIGRLLVLREVLGQAPPGFSAVTKTFCTELEQRVSAFTGRVIGAGALLWGPEDGLNGRVARSVCYAPAYSIMGGTTQVLRNIAGERLLGLPRHPEGSRPLSAATAPPSVTIDQGESGAGVGIPSGYTASVTAIPTVRLKKQIEGAEQLFYPYAPRDSNPEHAD